MRKRQWLAAHLDRFGRFEDLRAALGHSTAAARWLLQHWQIVVSVALALAAAIGGALSWLEARAVLIAVTVAIGIPIAAWVQRRAAAKSRRAQATLSDASVSSDTQTDRPLPVEVIEERWDNFRHGVLVLEPHLRLRGPAETRVLRVGIRGYAATRLAEGSDARRASTKRAAHNLSGRDPRRRYDYRMARERISSAPGQRAFRLHVDAERPWIPPCDQRAARAGLRT